MAVQPVGWKILRTFPSKVPLSHIIHVSLGLYTDLLSKRHLDRFTLFAHGHTDHTTCNRPHLCTACRRCGLINSTVYTFLIYFLSYGASRCLFATSEPNFVHQITLLLSNMIFLRRFYVTSHHAVYRQYMNDLFYTYTLDVVVFFSFVHVCKYVRKSPKFSHILGNRGQNTIRF